MAFTPIREIISQFRAGRIVVVVDDEDRENEGDLVIAAEKATPEDINFMTKRGRGLICAPLTEERLRELGLRRMVEESADRYDTAFTVSVDSKSGTTTGISAHDRAVTVNRLALSGAQEADFVQPGHVFPLIAKKGGVLRRAGHTEAAVDLARLAGLNPAGVICEILNEDGTMARLPELEKFAAKFDLSICTIADLIQYRRQTEKLITKALETRLPTEYGVFRLMLYHSDLEDAHHIALVMGNPDPERPSPVRVHSQCLTGDVFRSARCDCGLQLDTALRHIAREKHGALIYMRQEGRGIGLYNKLKAYALQDEGRDTVEANIELGFAPDLRDYGIGAQILRDLGFKKIKLLTNNPKKIIGLQGFDLEISERLPIETKSCADNENYLRTKKLKLGHMLDNM